MTRILVLGGTAEARALADALVARGEAVTTSLAGRTRDPLLPAGAHRAGGFGGVDGLAGALRGVDVLVDATHPFASTITEHAHAAAARTATPLVVLPMVLKLSIRCPIARVSKRSTPMICAVNVSKPASQPPEKGNKNSRPHR